MPAEELQRTTGGFTIISKSCTPGMNTSEWLFSLRGQSISAGVPWHSGVRFLWDSTLEEGRV